MNRQTKACFKREIFAYLRTHICLTIALVIIGMAIFSPLMIAGMGAFMTAMSDFYEELGTDITGMTEALGESTSIGLQSALESITGVGLIVMILLLNKAAGGEQKRRATMIPRSAGLQNFSYLLPKFIIYPLSGFVFSVVASLAAWMVSIPLFEVNDITFGNALLGGVLAGVSLMLYVSFHLALGTATGRAGMSAAVCITVSILLPAIMIQISPDYIYNPFTLQYLASSALQSRGLTQSQAVDIIVTICFALALIGVMFFIALFAQNAKRINNSGNELEL